MSSWIRCTCGKLNHKNLFADEKVCLVIEDEVLNRIEEDKSSADAVSTIIRSGDILVRCTCGRVAIEDKKTGQITIYAPELQ
jgi:hypothetical protein